MKKAKDETVLGAELETARRIHEKAMRNLPAGLSFEDLERIRAVTGDRVDELSRKHRMVKPYVLSKIPDYGERMSLTEFISCCKSGGFIDYDGYGNYVKDGKKADITIRPSDVKHRSVRKDFTEIIWFNR